MRLIDEQACLTNEQVAAWTKAVQEGYIAAAKRRALKTTRLRLMIEETLLRMQDAYGENAVCRLVVRKHFGKVIIEISQQGNQKDCIAAEDTDLQGAYDILAGLGVYPKYSYRGRTNTNLVTYICEEKPRKNRMLISLGIAILLAVLCYFGLQALSAEANSVATDVLTNVLFGKLVAIFSALATPLVFLAVIIGITGVGDIEQFGKMGRTVLGRMGVTYAIAAIVLLVFCVLAFGIQPTSNSSGGSAAEQVIALVLDMIPSNLVAPFSGDNDLQVIVLAIFIGIVMLMLGDKVEHINQLFQEASDLVNKMMLIVCELIPLIVFLGVLKLMCTSQIDQVIGMVNMIIVFLLGSAVVTGTLIVRTIVTMKVPFKTIFKKQLPTLLINLATGSQVSALPENMKCCKQGFGIDGKLCDFALPFGIVTYMPNGAIFLGVTVWGLAYINGAPVDVLMAVTTMIISVVVAIAAPPIPGNGYIVLPILLTSCGLPADYMTLGVVFATLIAYFLPAFNGYSIQLELLMAANKLGLVDRDKLEADVIEE